MRCLRSKQFWWICLVPVMTAGCGPTTPVDIVPAVLPDGVVGVAYLQVLTAAGVDRATWQITDGSLPPGLRLESDSGAIVGMPVQTGSFTFTVAVLTSLVPVPSGQASYTLTVVQPLTVDTGLLPARVGQYYQHSFVPAGGTPPFQFALIGLPAGLGFDGSTGTISGTPVIAVNKAPLQVTVTDGGRPPQQCDARLTLDIKPPVVRITTTSLPAGKINVAYSVQLVAEDGFEPYEWRSIGDWLPDDLRLNKLTGVISGTPRIAGTAEVEIQVLDDDSPPGTDTRSFLLTIEP